MTLPRQNDFQTADTHLIQISLQDHLDFRKNIDENQNPVLAALLDSAILECRDLINSDKFYDC